MTPAGLAALLLAGALTTGGAADGTLGVRLLDAPASARDARAQQYVVADVRPGEQVRRRLEVANGTDSPLRVHLYAAAAMDGPAGFAFAEGRTPNELSGWTAVRPEDVVLRPGGTAEVLVEVRVPPSATEGDHVAVVWAEQEGSVGGSLSLVSRVGMRVYLQVEGEAPVLLPAVLAGGLVLLGAAGVLTARRRVRRRPA